MIELKNILIECIIMIVLTSTWTAMKLVNFDKVNKNKTINYLDNSVPIMILFMTFFATNREVCVSLKEIFSNKALILIVLSIISSIASMMYVLIMKITGEIVCNGFVRKVIFFIKYWLSNALIMIMFLCFSIPFTVQISGFFTHLFD